MSRIFMAFACAAALSGMLQAHSLEAQQSQQMQQSQQTQQAMDSIPERQDRTHALPQRQDDMPRTSGTLPLIAAVGLIGLVGAGALTVAARREP